MKNGVLPLIHRFISKTVHRKTNMNSYAIYRMVAFQRSLIIPNLNFAAKQGSGTYGARHARARPYVMQWVLAVRETVVIKPSRLNIVAQGLSNFLPFPSLGLIHNSVSLEWALTRLQANSYRERLHSFYTSHTPSAKPDGVALHYTCPTPEAVHWTSSRGRGHAPPRKKKEEKRT